MAPFRAQIGGKRIREVENKNYRFTPFLSDAEQKMPKKKQKNLKKFKNTIRASFQAEIVLKRATKGENKNYRFVLFLPDALWKI